MDIQFSKKKHILEIFYHLANYSKKERGFQYHKQTKFQWPSSLISEAGFVKEQTLCLSEKVTQDQLMENCDVIIITDYHPEFSIADTKLLEDQGFMVERNRFVSNHFFKTNNSHCCYGILNFQVSDNLLVYLNYSYWGVGMPSRENFLITKFKKDQKVRIRINGKFDCSMSSRRERTFKEQDFLIHYHGTIDKYKLLDEKQIVIEKTISLENYRDIDVRKILF